MVRALTALLAVALCLAATAVVTERVDEAAGTAFEVGHRARTTPDARLVDAIARHPGPVFATLYLTEREDVPSALRSLEAQLVALCEALSRASAGRFGWALVHPDADDDARAFATARGVGERRVRRIERDGWSEASVYSTLELSGANGRSALIEGLAPEDLDDLQRRLAAHLQLLAEPARPRIALCAPASGYARLERELSDRGQVTRVALDGTDSAVLASCDLLVWTEPDAAQLAAGAVDRIEALMARGAALLLAASAREDALALSPDATGSGVVTTGRRDVDLDPLWRALALEPQDVLLFDETCVERVAGATSPDGAAENRRVRLPFVLRAIAPNQDFRRYDGQPNATLIFDSPTALALDEGGLTERGWRAHVLATSSDTSFAPGPEQNLGTGVPADALTYANGRALPKLPLLVELEPQRALEGRAVVATSARFFHDEFLAGEGAQPQRRALGLLVASLTDDARLVAARGAYQAPPRFESPSRASEIVWRVAGLAAVPLVLAVFALVHLRRVLGGGGATRGAGGALVAWGAIAATALVVGPLTSALLTSAEQVAPQLADLARAARANRGDVEVELVLPADHRLPADVRSAARPALARLRALAGAVDGLRASRVDSAALERDDPALALPSRTLVTRENDVVRARRVRMGLVVRGGERVETIELEDARAFEQLDFRLGHALWRLANDTRARVAFAASTPRLSSAEAHTEFQQLQLFAPTGDDVFSAARERLVRDGFEIVHIDPIQPAGGLTDVDALVWLQPRRSTIGMLGVLADVLRAGGGALVAGQAHEIVARQLEGRDLETAYWPRPTNADLNELWFADLGAVVVPVIVLDELVVADRADVRSDSDARGRVMSTQDRALPFQVRVSSSTFAEDGPLAGLRDLPWFGGNLVEIDSARMDALDLRTRVLASSGPNAWLHAWTGGYLTEPVLAGDDDAVAHMGAVPLVTEITGRFPAALPSGRAGDVDGADEGRLVLAGSSMLFANGHLGDERFGARGALTALTAALALPDEVAVLARRGERATGLGAVADARRTFWRSAGLAFAPLLALVVLLARRLVLALHLRGGVR